MLFRAPLRHGTCHACHTLVTPLHLYSIAYNGKVLWWPVWVLTLWALVSQIFITWPQSTREWIEQRVLTLFLPMNTSAIFYECLSLFSRIMYISWMFDRFSNKSNIRYDFLCFSISWEKNIYIFNWIQNSYLLVLEFT